MTEPAADTTARPLKTGDLTSAAKLRLSALELYAKRGEKDAGLRDIARHAGVAPGLVRHHFGSKEGLTRAVDDDIIDLVRATLDAVPLEGTPLEISAARDAAFLGLLESRPLVAGYVRQALLQPRLEEETLLDRLVDLSVEQTRELMNRGLDPRRGLRASAFSTLIRQVGRLVVTPAAERIWSRLQEADLPSGEAGPEGDLPVPPVTVTAGRA